MNWINFLHIYQPPTTDAHTIKEATESSYLRIIRALEEHPKTKFTINISGCLIPRWEELGYIDLIKRIERLIKKGQIELVGSAAYHPILPLIPIKEAKKQIKENEQILKKYFGKNIKLRGFFLPEMAYGEEVARLIKKLGYKWIIMDKISIAGSIKNIDFNSVYKDKNSGLDVVFRSEELSKSYVPDAILQLIKIGKKNQLIITATDGELYGLRHVDHTAEFEKLLKYNKLKTHTVSKFITGRKKRTAMILRPSSWESTEQELKKRQPYALWKNKKNKIQKKLWGLADFAYRTVENHSDDENYTWAKWHLSRGLSSCTFWWASARDFRLFGSISWGPDEIERGANELIRAIRTLEKETTRKTKIKAEKLYIKIKQMVWEKHWSYYWKKK